MKYVRFKREDKEHFGLLREDLVLTLSHEPWLGGSMVDDALNLSNVELLTPCRPSKIIGVAANFPGVSGSDDPIDEPFVFVKSLNSLISDGQPIMSSFPESSVWGEPELAIVIGERLSNASTHNASSAIFGYSIANDVTGLNAVGRDHHLARSKCADSFCPLGPFIETDFNPTGKKIRGFQNGRLIRDGLLDSRIFSEGEILSWLSKWITLEPGDIVLTGAPSRTGRKIFLKDGDSYRCEIEGLGSLINSFEQRFSDG